MNLESLNNQIYRITDMQRALERARRQTLFDQTKFWQSGEKHNKKTK